MSIQEKSGITFDSLQLLPEILKTLQQLEYTTPTPIQAQAIPVLLEGKDLIGVAQTGTGKTAAFALPILHKLISSRKGPKPRGGVRALILSPTRELACQISDSFRTYGRALGLSQQVVFGGTGYRDQIRALDRGVDILVATPGRLMDLMERGCVSLQQVEVFVLDEADQMFDMGFIRDVQHIVGELPAVRQTVMFSATMPPAIVKLASTILKEPVRITVSPVSSTSSTIDQKVIFVSRKDKPTALESIMKDTAVGQVIVFSRTKHGADKIADRLGMISESIHGDKRQSVRQRILDKFKKGRFKVLVATDVAARGIDVDGITHVINYDLPNMPESYVHRIGRTGRAGAQGTAISLCDRDEKGFLRSIEQLIKQKLTIIEGLPFCLPTQELTAPSQQREGNNFRRGGRSSQPFWKRRGGSGSSRGGDRDRNFGGGRRWDNARS